MCTRFLLSPDLVNLACMWSFWILANNLSSPKPWMLTSSITKPWHTVIVHVGLTEVQHRSPDRYKCSFHIYIRNYCLLQFQREVYIMITESRVRMHLYFQWNAGCWSLEPFQCFCSLHPLLHWQLCVTHCFARGGRKDRPMSPATELVGTVADHMATRSDNRNDSDGASHLPPVDSEPVLRLVQAMMPGTSKTEYSRYVQTLLL